MGTHLIALKGPFTLASTKEEKTDTVWLQRDVSTPGWYRYSKETSVYEFSGSGLWEYLNHLARLGGVERINAPETAAERAERFEYLDIKGKPADFAPADRYWRLRNEPEARNWPFYFFIVRSSNDDEDDGSRVCAPDECAVLLRQFKDHRDAAEKYASGDNGFYGRGRFMTVYDYIIKDLEEVAGNGYLWFL